MRLPEQVCHALERLGCAGHEAFVVGGAVRDGVRLGVMAQDWDIATDARPERVKELFASFRVVETGLRHGTVTVWLDGLPLEMTTYRVDGTYSDGRHPDSVHFSDSLRADLERRDFTINALAYHPDTGVVDLVGGLHDLQQGLIRCVGEPERRFREDALRVLRGLRLAAVYDMEIEAQTAAALHRSGPLLSAVAAERVQAELTRLLCGPAAARVLREFADVITVPLPELAPMVGFAQHNRYHNRDVWEHTLAVVEHCSPQPVLRWAALLHDVGKPDCFTLGEDGVGHFHGHGEQSVCRSEKLLERLRFDRRSKGQILQLVRHHDGPISPQRPSLRRLLSRHGPELTSCLLELHEADAWGKSDLCRPQVQCCRQARAVLEDILREEGCLSRSSLAVDGRDLLALGLRGTAVGRALEACLEQVLEGTLDNGREELLAFVRAGDWV